MDAFLTLVERKPIEPGDPVTVFDVTVPLGELWHPLVYVVDREADQPMSGVHGVATLTPATDDITFILDEFDLSSRRLRRSEAWSSWGGGDRFTLTLQTAETITLGVIIPVEITYGIGRWYYDESGELVEWPPKQTGPKR